MQHAPLPPDDGPLPFPEKQAAYDPHPPSFKALFLTWLRIGAFSFGGGASPLGASAGLGTYPLSRSPVALASAFRTPCAARSLAWRGES